MVTTHSTAQVLDDVIAAIRAILEQRTGRFGLDRVSVEPGADYDGDPVLFINADYRLSKTPVDFAATLAAQIEIWQALIELGENRFPHVRYHFQEGQKLLGVG